MMNTFFYLLLGALVGFVSVLGSPVEGTCRALGGSPFARSAEASTTARRHLTDSGTTDVVFRSARNLDDWRLRIRRDASSLVSDKQVCYTLRLFVTQFVTQRTDLPSPAAAIMVFKNLQSYVPHNGSNSNT